MDVFFIGNSNLSNGPAVVNKNLKKNFPETQIVTYIERRNLFLKFVEITKKVLKTNVVVISGLSFSGLIALFISRISKKKSIYLMHGYLNYEERINRTNDKMISEIKKLTESYILKNTTKILCVSENFMNWFRETRPTYKKKTMFLNNGIEWGEYKSVNHTHRKIKQEEKTIISIGGGRPQKNIIDICTSIEYINKKYKKNYRLKVIGEEGDDSHKIKQYSFVDYLGQIKHQDVLSELRKSDLFIQNSTFEPFGVAPIEALLCGCDILISKNVGSLSLIGEIGSKDIIYNPNNNNEIIQKILEFEFYSNNQKLINSIDREKTTYKSMANKLINYSFELTNNSFIN